jgi:hypothetical protein
LLGTLSQIFLFQYFFIHTILNLYKNYIKYHIFLEAYGLSLDQLSKVKTLYDTKLDKKLLIPLKVKFPALFEEPNE